MPKLMHLPEPGKEGGHLDKQDTFGCPKHPEIRTLSYVPGLSTVVAGHFPCPRIVCSSGRTLSYVPGLSAVVAGHYLMSQDCPQ